MKENQRKCLKCGRSPADDPAVKLFRFPQPGIRNTLRCESWAKYCFPDEQCSTNFQTKLYSEHRMLCDTHFKISSFIDFSTKKLHRYAVPEDNFIKRVVVDVPIATEPVAGPSRRALEDVTNFVESANLDVLNVTPVTLPRSMEPQPGPSHMQHIKQSQDVPHTTEATEKQEKKSKIPDTTSKQKYLYMKCRKNMKKICQLRNRIRQLKNNAVLKSIESDDAVKVLTHKITPTLALLLQGEIKNFRRKTKGRRWTKEQKITALRLYKRSPTCYNLLRRLFCLPAPSTLKMLLNQFPIGVGINKKIFKVLKKFAITEQPKDNEFVLTFDEMSIRKHLNYNTKDDVIEGYQDHADQGRTSQVASHALVFMICGVRRKLKQPVAFYLSGSSVTADRLAVLTKEVLHHCFEANINVSATVCDMNGVNRRALGILGASSQNPCIEINNRTVTTMFDPPHLLKCFRNLFMKYDVKHLTNITSGDTTGKGIAKWAHIKQFYELDNTNPNFVFAPSLRQEHLNPNSKQKMRVKLAAQVLSHSVAAGMYCKISQGELTTDATITANLVANMDKLFDCVNSNTPDWRRGKPHSTNLTEKTPHLSMFRDMKKFFESLEFLGCRSKPPSVEGWVWTLNAVDIYWQKLTSRHPNIKSLSTRRLQQDPLENLFGCIRGHCGSNTNPTTGQFVAGLKTSILSSLASSGVRGNCEGDDNTAILDNFKTLLSPETNIQQQQSTEIDLSHIKENIETCFEESLKEVNGEIQACAYVCGFLLKKYKTQCHVCKENLFSKDVEIEHTFVDFKEYSEIKRSLKYASKELIKSVEYCAITINKFLEKHSHQRNLKANILNNLKNTNHFNFLQCCEHKENNVQYITKSTFYICIKRFCTVHNRKFIEEASATALRKKINILKHT